jgi:hypothetical protein
MISMLKFSKLSLISLILIIIPGALSIVDIAQPWHPASQIAKSNSEINSIDNDNDGIIDEAETLKLVAGKARIGDGSSITVLEIAGHPNSFSAVDFFSGSQNTWGIGRNDLGSFYIDKSGVGNALIIDSDREVGIGIADPQNKLDVAGKIKATGDICTDANGGVCLGTLVTDDGDWVVSGNDIYSAKTGYVGILTQTPGSELHIKADSQYSGNADLELESFDGATKWTVSSENAGVFSIYDKTNDKFPFRIQKNSPSGAVFIADTGNIGIGTTDPKAKLDIIGNIKIKDGNEAAGKVLTSDSEGVGSWQEVKGSSQGLYGHVFIADGNYGPYNPPQCAPTSCNARAPAECVSYQCGIYQSGGPFADYTTDCYNAQCQSGYQMVTLSESNHPITGCRRNYYSCYKT